MARYKGAVCRLCRREGQKLYLKGEKCFNKDKCPLEKRNYPPGQHIDTRGKLTEYGLRLREKQKVKRIYGVLESQFKRYFEEAERMKGVTGENLLKLLEKRLDNVVYRLGFAVSRAQARQLVAHGHILVNGRKVDIPSYQVEVGDKIEVREKSKNLKIIQEAISFSEGKEVPKWLEVDREKLYGIVKAEPERSDIDFTVSEQLIVEFYSK